MGKMIDAIDKKRWIYGPFLGDLYTELKYWSPFLRNFYFKKTQYGDLNVSAFIICTRKSRKDLYYDFADKITTFDIPMDYMEYKTNLNTTNLLSDEQLKNIRSEIDSFFMNTAYRKSNPLEGFLDPNNFFHEDFKDEQFNYSFSPSKPNKIIVNDIVSKHPGKRIICLSAPLKSGNMKLWNSRRWTEILEFFFRHSDEFFVIVLGSKGTHFQTNSYFKNSINISSFCNDYYETTIHGLEIESLKYSDCLISVSPNVTITMAYLLRVPVFFLGNNVKEYLENENIFNVKTIGYNDKTYTYDSNIFFKNFMKFVK